MQDSLINVVGRSELYDKSVKSDLEIFWGQASIKDKSIYKREMRKIKANWKNWGNDYEDK